MIDCREFIKKIYDKPELEGCWYTLLGYDKDSEAVYLVFCYTNPDITCKIAHNIDDLQCDYDWDWDVINNAEWCDLFYNDWSEDEIYNAIKEACSKIIVSE